MKVASRASNPHKRLNPTTVDLTTWATVDSAEIKSKADRSMFTKRSDAVDVFTSGKGARAAAAIIGCSERNFRRLWSRCLKLAADGRIQGYRGLIYGLRIENFERVKPVVAIEGKPYAGFAGAFGALMREQSTIERGMVNALGRYGPKDIYRPNKLIGRELHKLFLELCKEAKIKADEYPLNMIEKGRRALFDWVRRDYIPLHEPEFVKGEHGQDAATAHGFQQDGEARQAPAQPWDEWQIDEVKIDVNARYELLSPDCTLVSLDLARTVGILCKDVGSGASPAWQHVIAREVNVADVLDLLWQAITGERKRKTGIPGCEVKEGGGFPAEKLPELKFALPRRIKLDNALAHLADPLRNALENVCAIEVVLGKPKTPKARASVEAEFSVLARSLLHKLPSTTGSSPTDPVRKKAATKLEGRIRIEDLEHLVDVYFANRNGVPHSASNGVAPLERLIHAARYGLLRPVVLPPDKRHAHFFGLRVQVKVRAELPKGRRPFVNFLGARYQGPSLKPYAGKVGTTLIARATARDLRTIVVFDTKGAELGTLRAEGKWGILPHDLRIRKLFLYLRRKHSLGEHAEDDPLRAIFRHLNKGAPRDATQAAQLAHVLGYLSSRGDELPRGVLSDVRELEALREAANDIELLPVLPAVPLAFPPAQPAFAAKLKAVPQPDASPPRESTLSKAQPSHEELVPPVLPIPLPITPPPAARQPYLLRQQTIRR